MKTYILYKATCKITNKVYIGYTNSNKGFERRKYEHYRNAFNGGTTKFYNALNKYPESFEWECLFQVNSHIKAKESEIKLIKEHNSYIDGYNSTIGGDGGDLSKHRGDHKRKIDEDVKKDIIDMYVSGIGKAEIHRKYPLISICLITSILDRNGIEKIPQLNKRNKKEKIQKEPHKSYIGENNSRFVFIECTMKLEMIRLYQSREMTKKEICNYFRIGYKVLSRIFFEYEIEKNKPQYC